MLTLPGMGPLERMRAARTKIWLNAAFVALGITFIGLSFLRLQYPHGNYVFIEPVAGVVWFAVGSISPTKNIRAFSTAKHQLRSTRS
jgi:hypothetical protein